MQDHSPVIKLVAHLHEQKNEIDNIQVSITALHKEKVVLANSFTKERNLNITKVALLRRFTQDKNILQVKARSRSLLHATLMWNFEVKKQDSIIEPCNILRKQLQISLQKLDKKIEFYAKQLASIKMNCAI